jgi:hypothetical protein
MYLPFSGEPKAAQHQLHSSSSQYIPTQFVPKDQENG